TNHLPGRTELITKIEFITKRWSLDLCRFLYCKLYISEVDLPLKKDGFTSESTTLEALLRGEGIEKKPDTKEEDTIQEIQRVLENDENADEVNEEEDLEEDIPKRKNRPRGRPKTPTWKKIFQKNARGSGGGRRRNDAASQDDHDKPYVCDICGKRYKNRPGLSYHYAHTHLASEEGDEAREQGTRSSPVHRNENHKPSQEPMRYGQQPCEYEDHPWGKSQMPE
ncbi:PREDICTED: zinc finger protein DPF3-like, partial [Fulmarus glacialis]|uniref:zinc finger protein DPF3-like n=1 Tax=Fulmarus glacialis TaxID=30455 RepID=UPI00051B0DF7